jgi:hypothetical protein
MPYPVTLYLDDPDHKCSKRLVKYLAKKGYKFTIVDRTSPESIESLKYHGHMYALAPIMQIDKAFFYEDRLYDPYTHKLWGIAKQYLKSMGMTNIMAMAIDSGIGVEA